MLSRLSRDNSTTLFRLETVEGGAMYSAQPGMMYYDRGSFSAEALPVPQAEPSQAELFRNFSDPWLIATVEVCHRQ